MFRMAAHAKKPSEETDLLVLGDGPIAHSLSLALRATPLRITIVDTFPQGRERPASGERSLALALSSLRLLQGLGVPLEDGSSGTIRSVRISQQGGKSSVLLDHSLLGVPEACLGKVFPLESLARSLLHAIPESGIFLARKHWGAPERFSWFPDRIEAEWAGHRVAAKLLVVADGGNGRHGRLLGLRRLGWDHNRHAILAQVGHGSPAGETAHEHFLESGPLALLPLAGSQGYSVVWSLLPGEASTILGLSDAGFLRALNARIPPGFPPLTKTGPRFSYPLHFQHFSSDPQSRIIPLGNAAQTLHPLAGQGYNLGLRDAITLAALLREAALAGSDPGASAILSDFQKIRLRDRWETIAFTESMNRLFALGPLPFRWGRAIALHALERTPRIKAALAGRLAGISLPAASTIPDLRVASHVR